MALASLIEPSPVVLSWLPGVAAAYLWLAIELGPRLMKTRDPVRPKALVVVYNALQVLFNASLLRRSLMLMTDERYHLTCPPSLPPLDVAVTAADRLDDFAKEAMAIVYHQTILRIFDLVDTAFIILAKKNSNLSFLHLYHHASVVITCWYVMKTDAGASITMFPAVVNNFVHANMYFYYLLTSLGFTVSPVFKRLVTKIQIIQFVAVFCYICYVVLKRECNLAGGIIFINVLQSLFFLVLFVNFYLKSYRRKKVV